ncbi:VOC family protein [Patescibacteria group bacterium]|nr:VOC family protein [Patescibacteria group bacterium]
MERKSPALIPELKVTDFNKSREFYTKLAQFDVEYQRPEEEFAMLSKGRAWVMIESLTEKSRTMQVGALEYPLGRGMHFQIEVEDVEALYTNFKDNAYPIFSEMEDKWYRTGATEGGNRQFWVQDPDGYLLRFYQDLGERPAA